MHRHDLVYLQASDRYTFLDSSLPTVVFKTVEAMVRQNLPFTLCRQTIPNKTQIATSCLIETQKYRVALVLDETPKRIAHPLSLNSILTLLSDAFQSITQKFINSCQNLSCDIFVYGSFSNQILTGLPFLTQNSDLDMLLVLQDNLKLLDLLVTVEQFKADTAKVSDLRIDGEIRLNNQDISFNELLLAKQNNLSSILVKNLYEVKLVPLTSILPI